MSRSAWQASVGINVLVARTRAKKAQADLGVSPTTVAKLESGGGATLTVIEKVAAALKLADPGTLCLTSPVRSDEDTRAFLAEVARMFTDPTRRRLMHVIGSVRDEDLADFEEHVEGFKRRKGQRPRDRLQRR